MNCGNWSQLLTPTGSWNYTYDVDNLRTTRTGTDNGTNYSYQYYYDGGKLVRMVRNGQTVDIAYAGGIPMTMTYGGNVYYYVTNMQGDVLALTDADKNIVASYSYEAYGAPVTTTGTLAEINPLRYRGYVFDQETGLYYLQSRYYDPEMCRFISADSYASTGQGILGFNMFAYCCNNPVNMKDFGGTTPVFVVSDVESEMVVDNSDMIIVTLTIAYIEYASLSDMETSTNGKVKTISITYTYKWQNNCFYIDNKQENAIYLAHPVFADVFASYMAIYLPGRTELGISVEIQAHAIAYNMKFMESSSNIADIGGVYGSNMDPNALYFELASDLGFIRDTLNNYASYIIK